VWGFKFTPEKTLPDSTVDMLKDVLNMIYIELKGIYQSKHLYCRVHIFRAHVYTVHL